MSARRSVTLRMLPEVRSKSVLAMTIGVVRATLYAHLGALALGARGERKTRAC